MRSIEQLKIGLIITLVCSIGIGIPLGAVYAIDLVSDSVFLYVITLFLGVALATSCVSFIVEKIYKPKTKG
ncbi:hypothetical protein LCM23_13135 [Cytobacillus kochii]|uniref:hypothetical protein n=1 Tax=Cytobacillus kochii TaxID=859143 RepID=UPI001CD5C40E|nr:hypothetical protein [Cytobacillus kochii]MCA1027039.1 hypothetical protein [Cytobacillus kochii]